MQALALERLGRAEEARTRPIRKLSRDLSGPIAIMLLGSKQLQRCVAVEILKFKGFSKSFSLNSLSPSCPPWLFRIGANKQCRVLSGLGHKKVSQLE